MTKSKNNKNLFIEKINSSKIEEFIEYYNTHISLSYKKYDRVFYTPKDMYLRFSRYILRCEDDPLRLGVVYMRRCRRQYGEKPRIFYSFIYEGTRFYAGKKSGVCNVC